MIKKIILSILLLFVITAKSQQVIVWQTLMLTTYESIAGGEDDGLYKPHFPTFVEKLEGQEVIISGYIIPIDITTNQYALSMSPFSSCFFCGNAGPNTVIELKFKDSQSKFLVDQFVMVKGRFKLNRNNPRKLFFVIQNAEIHG